MIDALIAGRLHGGAEQRTAKNGNPYTVAKVRVSTSSGDAVFVNVIAFNAEPGAALLALGDGDGVAIAGELTPKAWTDKAGVARPSLDLTAHAVLSEYHVMRKRKALEAET